MKGSLGAGIENQPFISGCAICKVSWGSQSAGMTRDTEALADKVRFGTRS